jgi:hypothetical protein
VHSVHEERSKLELHSVYNHPSVISAASVISLANHLGLSTYRLAWTCSLLPPLSTLTWFYLIAVTLYTWVLITAAPFRTWIPHRPQIRHRGRHAFAHPLQLRDTAAVFQTHDGDSLPPCRHSGYDHREMRVACVGSIERCVLRVCVYLAL